MPKAKCCPTVMLQIHVHQEMDCQVDIRMDEWMKGNGWIDGTRGWADVGDLGSFMCV